MKKIVLSLAISSMLAMLSIPVSFAKEVPISQTNVIQTYEQSQDNTIDSINLNVIGEAKPIFAAESKTFSALSESIPYNFTFNFDSSLISQSITNSNSTVKITTTSVSWDDTSDKDWTGSSYNYYHITLYANGNSMGSIKYNVTSGSLVGTWNNVPSGTIYFKMTKPSITWSEFVNGSEIYDGDISGSGTVSN